MAVSEGTGKPEKIKLDEFLKEGPSAPADDEDGIIEVVAGTEPGAEPTAASGEDVAGEAEGAGAAAEEALSSLAVEDLLQRTIRENERLQDHYLRARADLENFRRRVERNRDEDSLRIVRAMLLEILPAIDSLDRALAMPADAPGFREGIALIRRQIEDALRKLGVEAIDALGESFDPTRHEALSAEPREGLAPNSIIEEVQKGYMIRGRVLRPSLVKVVMAPPPGGIEAGGQGDEGGTDHRD